MVILACLLVQTVLQIREGGEEAFRESEGLMNGREYKVILAAIIEIPTNLEDTVIVLALLSTITPI